MSKTVSSLVLSDFEDASTGDRFAEGDTVPLERGVFDNFEAAGLVREADAPKADESAPPAPPAKPKTPAKRPRAAK